MQTLVDQQRDLVIDSLAYLQPMKITQCRLNVIKLTQPCDQPGCSVLDELHPPYEAVAYSS